jgi:hypothetical protein
LTRRKILTRKLRVHQIIVAVEKLRGTGQKRKFQQLRCTLFLAGSLTKAVIWFFIWNKKAGLNS